MRDCGFTAAAFVTPDQLPLCEKLGMPALVAPNDRGLKHWRDMSDAQITQYVTTLVDQSKHSTAVMGYFLTDEPGVRDFPALAKAVALVKQLAPGKLAYINLLPNYATLGAPDLSQLGTPNYTEYLERYVTEVKPQFISYDNYQVLFSDDLKNENALGQLFHEPCRSPPGGDGTSPALLEHRLVQRNPPQDADPIARELPDAGLHDARRRRIAG